MDFFDFATDNDTEENGTWFPVGGGSELLVARNNNKAYGKALTSEYERHRHLLELGGDAADKQSEELMIGVLASTVLLGWRTKQADGSYAPTITFKKKQVEYSVAAAKELLEMREFRRMVLKFADTVEAYKLKQEVEQGNA